MAKRKHPDLMSKKEYAKLKDKLNPDYNLPKIEKRTKISQRNGMIKKYKHFYFLRNWPKNLRNYK